MAVAEKTISETLQAGILKPHGRNYTCYIFCRLKEDPETIGRLVEVLAGQATSYYTQLEETRKYREEAEQAGKTLIEGELEGGIVHRCKIIKNIALGGGFYAKCQLKETKQYSDEVFAKGIKGEDGRLPFYVANYTEGFELKDDGPGPFDIMLRFAGDVLKQLEEEVNELIYSEPFSDALLESPVTNHALVIEYSYAAKLKKKQGLGFHKNKPLGFIDGISERRGIEETARQTLFNETDNSKPGKPATYGSYLFFQKIEINQKKFENIRNRIAQTFREDGDNKYVSIREGMPIDAAEAKEDDKKLAEALLMGRFANGSPLMHGYETSGLDVDTPLSYTQDKKGTLCPFQAHIRIVNPRQAGFENAGIVRRGTYFGDYDAKANKLEIIKGLHFVSFQKSIDEQLLPILQRMKDEETRDPIAYGGNGDVNFFIPAGNYRDGKRFKVNIVADQVIPVYIGGDFFYMPSLPALAEYVEHCRHFRPPEEIT